ncbi:MAG: glycine zipper 2TM domain-containing protein [Methylovulum sp.]|nr:glycine zipper 2TM domain-containing protein [Methylovulum sp.]
MKNLHTIALSAAALVMVANLAGCAGMSTQGRNTVIGAGLGAAGGAAATGGSPLGTVGGAAVGGLIGHEISKPNK